MAISTRLRISLCYIRHTNDLQQSTRIDAVDGAQVTTCFRVSEQRGTLESMKEVALLAGLSFLLEEVDCQLPLLRPAEHTDVNNITRE